MKNFSKLNLKLFRFFMLSTIITMSFSAQVYGKGAGVVSQYGRLQVSNAHVCAQDGTQISLGGMSFFWSNWSGSYYTASTVNYLVDQMQVSVVRAAYGCPINDGGPDGDYNKIYAVVDAAIAKGIYVIIDWHVEGDTWAYRSQAEAFFKTMAQKYGNTPNVIYEPWNEPTSQSANSIKDWCVVMKNVIRAYDPDNLIICGSGTWSQYPNSYSISDPNVAYTFHGYFDDGNGANHRSQFYTNVAAAMAMGNAVFVTEFGANYGTTSGTNEIINKCQEWNISMCAWAVNDKVEPWSIFCSGSGTGCLTAIGNFYKSKFVSWPSAGGVIPTCTTVDITGAIEAENYCQMSGVQKETCTEGGSDIGWIDTNDYMTYSVNVPTAGSYTIQYRVASANGGGIIQLEKAGGGAVYGTVNVQPTGGWQTWTTITQTVTLPAGEQSLAIKANAGGFNLNWWGNGNSNNGGTTKTIQAESYADMLGVKTETTSDAGGGLNVGYIDANDWMSYTNSIVNVPTTGTYTIEYRVASLNGGGRLQFEEAGGGTVYGAVDIDATGGWQTWKTIKQTVTLSAGNHTFGIKAVTGGWNFNWFAITAGLKSAQIETEIAPSTVVEYTVSPNPCTNYVRLQLPSDTKVQVQIMDITGKSLISKDLDANDNEIDVSALRSGMYVIRIFDGNNICAKKLIKK